MTKKEMAFDWIIKPENISTKNLAKIVAKTPASTDHRNDKSIPESERVIRKFSLEELKEAARSLAERVIGINHQRIIDGAVVIDSQWNEIEQAVECLAYLPTEYINKIKEGKISTVSVEFNHRDEIRTDDTIEYKGLVFNRIDLLEGKTAGDPATQITLFESKDGAIEGQIVVAKENLGEPMAQFSDWDACIAWASEQPDITDPEAYCGYIKSQTEAGKTKEEIIESLKGMTFKKKESTNDPPKKTPEEIIVEKDKRIIELETAVATATKATEDLKTEHDKKIAEAKTEAKKEVLEKIKQKIPPQFIENRFGLGAKRFAEEIKKVVREESKEE